MIQAWFYKQIDDILFPCSFLAYVIDSTSEKLSKDLTKKASKEVI